MGRQDGRGRPSNFYEAGYFCDYPPAYMLVLWLFGLLGGLLVSAREAWPSRDG